MATRAERLTALCKKLDPSIARFVDGGEWGPTGCPYVIDEAANGKVRVRVSDPATGSVLGAVGATTEDALAELEVMFEQLFPGRSENDDRPAWKPRSK